MHVSADPKCLLFAAEGNLARTPDNRDTINSTTNKMSRVYSQYWHPAFGRHLEFAALSECRYWELLQYPDLPTPRLAEGSLNDTSLAAWFSKVYLKTSQRRTTDWMWYRILVYLLRHNIGGQNLLVVYDCCESWCRNYKKVNTDFTFRIVTCDVDPETHIPTIAFTIESYSTIERELGLPNTFMSHMITNLIRTTSFSTYKKNTKPLKGMNYPFGKHICQRI